LTYLVTLTQERRQDKKETSTRWALKRMEAYVEYVTSAQLVVAAARRLALGTPEGSLLGNDKTEALTELESAHIRRALATEAVRMVGTPVLVEKAHLLNLAVWKLQEIAREDLPWSEPEWRVSYIDYLDALHSAQKAARGELNVPGDIPDPPQPPEWFFRRFPSQDDR
jgi:hypothetical protein